MRIEINISEKVAIAMKERAKRVNQSRKGYIELLCILDAEKLIEVKDESVTCNCIHSGFYEKKERENNVCGNCLKPINNVDEPKKINHNGKTQ